MVTFGLSCLTCPPHKSHTPKLVGGWTNPFDQYWSKWVHLPQIVGVNIKKNELPPPITKTSSKTGWFSHSDWFPRKKPWRQPSPRSHGPRVRRTWMTSILNLKGSSYNGHLTSSAKARDDDRHHKVFRSHGSVVTILTVDFLIPKKRSSSFNSTWKKCLTTTCASFNFKLCTCVYIYMIIYMYMQCGQITTNSYTWLYGISGKFPHFSPPFDLGWGRVQVDQLLPPYTKGNPLHGMINKKTFLCLILDFQGIYSWNLFVLCFVARALQNKVLSQKQRESFWVPGIYTYKD